MAGQPSGDQIDVVLFMVPWGGVCGFPGGWLGGGKNGVMAVGSGG